MFYTNLHELKMKLKDKPTKTSEAAAPKTKKMVKKGTSKTTEAAFDTQGQDTDPQRVVWDGARLILEYSDEKHAKHAFKDFAEQIFY